MIVTLQKKGDNYIFVSNNIYELDKTVEEKEEQKSTNKIQNTTEIIEKQKSTNKTQNINVNKDNSIATKKIPKAGKNNMILIIIAIGIGIICTIQLYNYKNIK